jgi:hypothetical protein
MALMSTKPSPTCRLSLLAATLAALIAFAPGKAVRAQQPAPAVKTAPSDSMKIDPSWLQLPSDTDFSKNTQGFKPPSQPEEKFELPGKFQFGKSELQMKTSREDLIPRIGANALDPSVINPARMQDRDDRLMPRYFGFTLSTPTH